LRGRVLWDGVRWLPRPPPRGRSEARSVVRFWVSDSESRWAARCGGKLMCLPVKAMTSGFPIQRMRGPTCIAGPALGVRAAARPYGLGSTSTGAHNPSAGLPSGGSTTPGVAARCCSFGRGRHSQAHADPSPHDAAHPLAADLHAEPNVGRDSFSSPANAVHRRAEHVFQGDFLAVIHVDPAVACMGPRPNDSLAGSNEPTSGVSTTCLSGGRVVPSARTRGRPGKGVRRWAFDEAEERGNVTARRPLTGLSVIFAWATRRRYRVQRRP